jgi:hypothetical protein
MQQLTATHLRFKNLEMQQITYNIYYKLYRLVEIPPTVNLARLTGVDNFKFVYKKEAREGWCGD